MQILFSADWHIKLGQKNVPIDWAKNRYNEFFSQIQSIEQSCDIHIIGGDIFDRVPSLEELELYFDFIKNCSIETYIYDGNHEATKKNKTFFTALKEVTRAINNKVTIIDDIFKTDSFSILPYCSLYQKNSIESLPHKNPVFTHVRGEIPPHVTPEVDLKRFEKFPIVFAGDLHSHSNSQLNIVYPGSPMTTSFHRSKVDTGVLSIDTLTWEWEWIKLKLPQLIRKTIQNPDEMVKGDYDYIIYELEGDLGDLAKVSSTDLLDKKLIKRNSETSLILEKDMSIGEELIEYLKYILQIDEKKIPQIIGIYNDYAKTLEME